MKKKIASLASLLLLLNSCTGSLITFNVTQVVTQESLSQMQMNSITRGVMSVAKIFEDITPDQEYFIGRAVGAAIVNRHSVYPNQTATHYLNLLGQTLARASDRPETFKGYHFLILNTEEVNAYAAPSGFIFISKGMIRLCHNEGDLAAVLAHEIAHVQHSHALKSISTSRITTALTTLGTETIKQHSPEAVSKITAAFESSINDIAETMINKGYSRELEHQADLTALSITKRVGYNPNGLIDVLNRMKSIVDRKYSGFASTHPDPNDRIFELNSLIDKNTPSASSTPRQKRFDDFTMSLSF